MSCQNDPDYSCAYVTLLTDTDVTGFGLTFTLGRGTEIGNYTMVEIYRHSDKIYPNAIVNSKQLLVESMCKIMLIYY